MTPLEILLAAKEKIADPARWTQGSRARDAEGALVCTGSRQAVCWCSEGAIFAVIRTEEGRHEMNAAEAFLDKASGLSLQCAYIFYNDSHSHAEVLSMFDRAIELAGAV